jgi:hypothetical protein
MTDKKQYHRDYYNKNKVKLRQQALTYYYTNSDDINNSRKGRQSEYMKKYYKENKEKFNQRSKTEEVRVRQRISSLKHYYNNRDDINEKRKKKYHTTKPPPKPKPTPKPKPPRKQKKPKYITPPTKHIITDDGKILLRF